MAGVAALALAGGFLAFSGPSPVGAQGAETVPSVGAPTGLTGAAPSIIATTTTKPPECTDVVDPSVVFVGTITGLTGVTARYAVAQIRAGKLPGTRVPVDYPDDIRFLKQGRQYIVGAVLDPTTRRLRSKVRPPPGTAKDDPCTERDKVITHNVDGTKVDTGVFSGLSGRGWQVVWAFVLPTLIALGVLTLLVLLKRAGLGAFRLSLRGGSRPPPPSPPPDRGRPAPGPGPPSGRTPTRRDEPARR